MNSVPLVRKGLDILHKLLRRLLLLLLRLWGAAATRAAARRHRGPAPAAPRILLVRPDRLGDLVLTTPVLHALRVAVPHAHITMMVDPGMREVVERHPDVDSVLTCSFPGIRGPFLTHAGSPQSHEHITASCLHLVSTGLRAPGYPALAEPYLPDRYPLYLLPTPQERQGAERHLLAEGIDATTPLVVIHPGSMAEVKLWRAEAWSRCAATLRQAVVDGSSVRIVLTGSTGERALLREIARGTSARTTLLTDTTIGQLAALLQRTQLVLGVDSGPLHLATAQGTPRSRGTTSWIGCPARKRVQAQKRAG